MRENCSSGCLKYVEAYTNFKNVVDSCFGLTLKENYEENIIKFKKSYVDLKIPITPKVHAVFFHVKDFCKKYNCGLGFYCEQAVESVHFDFQSTWSKYKVPKNHTEYDSRLLKATCEYNSYHT